MMFVIGSVVAALSTSIYGLIVGRALQGSGAISGTLMAMVSDLTSEQNRTKAMATIGASIGVYFAVSMLLGPVLAQTARLVFIAVGGWWLSTHDASAGSFYVLAAISMVMLGALASASVLFTRWGPKRISVPERPAMS